MAMEEVNNQSNLNNVPGDSLLTEEKVGSKKLRKFNKTKKNVKSKEEKNVLSSKKWWCLDSLVDEKEESLASVLTRLILRLKRKEDIPHHSLCPRIAWGRERGFYFLGIFCLLMCAFLFALQAYMAYRSYKMLHQITTQRHIPETVYKIYFDGNDWALDLDKVDLRANTSLFMH